MTPLTMYSENGCLLCREAEGTLRVLLGDTPFEQHFRVEKMTFQPERQTAFKRITGSATIPKLYRGDFETGTPLADDFKAIMACVRSGEAYSWVGQHAPAYPAREAADALVLGAGPAGLAAAARLVEAGHAPLIVSETMGGKLLCAKALPDRNDQPGLDAFRALLEGVPAWRARLRPGVEVDALRIEGELKTLEGSGRSYTTTGPLVIALGASIQHFELQTELDFLDQGLHYAADWVRFSGGRATVYASRGGGCARGLGRADAARARRRCGPHLAGRSSARFA